MQQPIKLNHQGPGYEPNIKFERPKKGRTFGYEVILKTHWLTHYFKGLECHHLIYQVLDATCSQADVALYDVHLYDYAVHFKIDATPKTAIKPLVQKIAKCLVHAVDDTFPDLQLKKHASGGTLISLWHHPYYLQTIEPQLHSDAAHYLNPNE